MGIINRSTESGGCYECARLRGTILNVETGQTVAICLEHQIQDAPPAKDGCGRPLLIPRYTHKVRPVRGRKGMRKTEDEICPKCGNQEIYIQRDGKTLRCWNCKHKWLGNWVKEDKKK